MTAENSVVCEVCNQLKYSYTDTYHNGMLVGVITGTYNCACKEAST